MDVGIDLGTTYSVIAIKGKVDLVDGTPQGIYLPECDVTIVPTPEGDPTFPSAFWIDPTDPNHVEFGTAAKQLAQEGQTPILFSKRSIGTTEDLRIGALRFTAREVATRFLAYLKNCAEQALGQSVDRAVVTHPAYFDPNQIEETKRAAEEAGFDMSREEQVMMEPAAAALAYTQGDDRDPLRVMTYDLGGGTFDVTILERNQGVITMKGFDGDHLLGGYDFDKRFIEWVLGELAKQGREIPYDDNNVEHQARRGRMLQMAESIKMQLSQQRSPRVYVNVRIDFLEDTEGNRVQFVGRINQVEYAALIADYLEKTIDCCHSALAKAELELEDLDAILLVGGSTYAPWVQEAVKKAFGKDAEVYNPDLCVGAGAAIRAVGLPPPPPKESPYLLHLDVESSCLLPTTNVAGRIQLRDGTPFTAETRKKLFVQLTLPSGETIDPTSWDDHGSFLFQDVLLADEGERTEFTFLVSDSAGKLILSHAFGIMYQTEGGLGDNISSVLPKPIFVKTLEGLTAVAKEGEQLPAKCQVNLKMLHNEQSVSIEVVQEREVIGTIVLSDIPPEAGEGSLIRVQVEITKNRVMKGTATIYHPRNSTILSEKPVTITFPPIKVPQLAELMARFEELDGRREQDILYVEDPERRLILQGPAGKKAKEIERLLKEQPPDRQQVLRALTEFEGLLNPPKEDMDPPRSDFLGLVGECRNWIASKPDDKAIRDFSGILDKIEKRGNDAYAQKNTKQWSTQYDQMSQLHSRIKKLVVGTGSESSGTPPPEVPPTPILKDHGRMQINQQRAALRAKREPMKERCKNDADRQNLAKRCGDIESLLNSMEADIDKIDDNLAPSQGLAKVQLVMRSMKKVEEKMERLDAEVGKA